MNPNEDNEEPTDEELEGLEVHDVNKPDEE